MTKALKTKIMCYVTSIVINAYLVFSYVRSHEIGTLPQIDQYHVLCDAFFLPGLIMIFLGLLMVMNNLGALDTMAYGSIVQPLQANMGNYWTPAESMGKELVAGTVTHDNAADKTEAMNTSMNTSAVQ